MSYHLGIDIGASRVHAATARRSRSGAELVGVFQLGDSSVDMPALVCVTTKGGLEFGEAAATRGATHPELLIGGIRERIGTGVPFAVDSEELTAEDAYALLAAAVVDTVSAAEGEAPDRVVVTHPAAWKAHRLGLVRGALSSHCSGDVELMPEPQAAAWGTGRPAREGQVVALYDLGGTTLDTALLREEAGGWSDQAIATSSVAIGGADFDDAIASKVLAATPDQTRETRDSLVAIRSEALGAKEALSSWPEVSIPTRGADGGAAVHLTQDDLTTLIHGLLDQTFDALRATIDEGGLSVDDVSAVVLAGGSARIPGLVERLSAALDVPVTTDTDPGSLIAVGAARASLERHDTDEVEPDEADDEPLSRDAEVAALMPDFIPAGQARLATFLWRVVVAALVIASAVYLVWSLSSGVAVPFGAGPGAGSVLDRGRSG